MQSKGHQCHLDNRDEGIEVSQCLLRGEVRKMLVVLEGVFAEREALAIVTVFNENHHPCQL